jgi:DNA-binding response OmpR family regulator
MPPHVLVADDDAWILRMVATVLEKRGYSVETAVDGEDALQRALARVPDLLITDVMMPKMDGWSLVRQLRSHAELAMLPVIFLTALSSEDDRIRGFRLGADDYVSKPFRFEELDLRVAKTLRRTAAVMQEARDQLGSSSLRGDLSQVGLSSLLVLIEMERKTGLLQLRAPNGPSAQVLVRDGKVVHARLDDVEEPVDAECVYYLLTWGAGEFEFTACLVEGADRVSVSTMHLLMEGARLMDEASEAAAREPDAGLDDAFAPIPSLVDQPGLAARTAAAAAAAAALPEHELVPHAPPARDSRSLAVPSLQPSALGTPPVDAPPFDGALLDASLDAPSLDAAMDADGASIDGDPPTTVTPDDGWT